MTEEKEKIINAFNNAWNRKIASENSYGKLASKEMFENKDFEILAKSLYKRIEELEKENEALAFRERLYKADYEASEQENKELKTKLDVFAFTISNYESALEEIRKILLEHSCADSHTTKYITNKINEVLNENTEN